MNIHTQQTDCEAEIAAGAWGLGPRHPTTAHWKGRYSSVWEDGHRAKLPNCWQDRAGLEGMFPHKSTK